MSAKPILKLVTCHRGQAARFLLRTRPNGAGLTRINTGSLKGCWSFRHPQGRVTIVGVDLQARYSGAVKSND